jgi:hypothetical protein
MDGAWLAWLEDGAAKQEAPEELRVIATQQEAPKGRRPRMRLMTSHKSHTGQINFNSHLMIFYIIKEMNSNFAGCDALS